MIIIIHVRDSNVSLQTDLLRGSLRQQIHISELNDAFIKAWIPQNSLFIIEDILDNRVLKGGFGYRFGSRVEVEGLSKSAC